MKSYRKTPQSKKPTAYHFAGAGLELAGVCLFGAILGHLVDRYVLHSEHSVGLAIGAGLGFAAGLLRFIRLAVQYNNPS